MNDSLVSFHFVCHRALYRLVFFGNDVEPVGARFLEGLVVVLWSYVKSLICKRIMFSDMCVRMGSYVC